MSLQQSRGQNRDVPLISTTDRLLLQVDRSAIHAWRDKRITILARRDILNAANNSYRDTQRVQSAAKGSDLENINDWLLLVTHDPRSKFVRKKANGMLTQAGVSNGGD